MKVIIVNTSDIRGGAAIAAFRLFKALRVKLPETLMLVGEKLSNTDHIKRLDIGFYNRSAFKFRFYLERVYYIFKAKSKDLWFSFSPANVGQDISYLPVIKNADIIHLHWINGGFLSLKSLSKIAKTGKPIVWTLQDMWAFTGGCHYAGTCTHFMKECGDCKFLKYPSKGDLSNQILKRKREIFSRANISFVASSNWMAENAKKSNLIGNCRIEVLPNPINTETFKPADKKEIRDQLGLPNDRFLILSGAANLKDKRKGFIYLQQALAKMVNADENVSNTFGLITFGKSSEVENSVIPLYPQSYLNDDEAIARLYQAADVYVIPTLEDNLPSTVMESLACGTPVVAFNTGGIPDMVDHKISGYLAEFKNTDDLISGINWVKNNSELPVIKENCRKKVLKNFTMEIIAERYINFYKSIIQ